MSVRLIGGLAIRASQTRTALQCWAHPTSATEAEKRCSSAGDELVSSTRWQLARAATVAVRATEVWPWLVETAYPRYRVGWNAPYRLVRAVWRIKERTGA
jgi:hypothetical protein